MWNKLKHLFRHKGALAGADDFEPYCTEKVLQERETDVLSIGEHKAITKIGARYGAEL